MSDKRSTVSRHSAVAKSDSHIARVEPAGIEIEVHHGETLFVAACRQGYRWPTICMGQGLCTHCHVRILRGESAVSPLDSEREGRAIRRIAQRLYGNDAKGLRLACQIELLDDIVVEQATFGGERSQST